MKKTNIAGNFVYVIGLIILTGILFGYPLMILWNLIMPHLFGFPLISFWEAIGLNLMAGILFRTRPNTSK